MSSKNTRPVLQGVAYCMLGRVTPGVGRQRWARFLVGVADKGVPDLTWRFLELNGGPAVLALSGEKPDSVFQLDVMDGRVQSVYIIRNPDKLRSLTDL